MAFFERAARNPRIKLRISIFLNYERMITKKKKKKSCKMLRKQVGNNFYDDEKNKIGNDR